MMSNEVLVFAEQKNDSLTTSAKGALGAAGEVAKEKSMSISALVIGSGLNNSIKECFSLGASKVYKFDNEELKYYRTMPYAKVMNKVIDENSPEVLIFGYSSSTTDLAPRVAYSHSSAVLTGVSKLSWDGEKLIAEKSAYNDKMNFKFALNGKLKAVILGLGAYPAPPKQEGNSGEEISGEISLDSTDLAEELLGVEMVEKTVDLSAAKFIVSGGRGAGSAEKFKIIFETAEKLGAQAASSRAVWDAGWTEEDIHVGQTGGSVSPDIYIACGISGAIQHVAGIKKSKTIIVVNTDPDAPIWEVAHYGIVGDMHKVLPLLIEKLG